MAGMENGKCNRMNESMMALVAKRMRISSKNTALWNFAARTELHYRGQKSIDGLLQN
jgi:hypothetical protein